MKFKKLWLYILTPLLVLLGSAALTNTVQAKELQHVITNVQMWDVDNGGVKKPNADGTYELTMNNDYPNYKYMVDFDLSNYNGKLEEGDTFTFTIPAPLTVENKTFDITDKSTGVAVASAKVVSSGKNAGGKVTMTLQNLKAYLAKKGGTQVNDVSGTFYTGFSIRQDTSKTTITYPTTETKDKITHVIKSKKPSTPDYGNEVGVTNFAKVNGIITKEHWESKLLNKSGEYHHPFIIRVNDRQASYNTLEIHDSILEDGYSPAQFVPESLEIKYGYYDERYSFHDEKPMKEGVDYTVEWNDSYTDFKIKISNASSKKASNGKPASFRITYKTTAPGDGTKIGNSAEVKGDDVPLSSRTDETKTKLIVSRNSQITDGGTIQLKTGYRITLYKVDEKTLDRLVGAKFKITPPSGATATEETVTTNADGVAQSSVYSEDDVKKGNFTVTEVEAPKGYELDSTPFEVTVGKDGVIKTVKNKRASAKAQLSAIKKLTGRAMKAGEFEFDLFDDKTNKVVETVTNDQDGNIKFAELSFDQEGEYTYHIVEKKANTTEKGVTYDANPVEVKVTVTTDATTGKLVAAVSYESDDKTFENTYAAEKTSASLEVTKKLTGRELKADEFEFTLTDQDGNVKETVKNDKDGNVKFSELEFDKAGTYTYKIAEKAGTATGIQYDTKTITATVTVADNGKGVLEATVAYDGEKAFENTYTPAGATSVTLGAKKVLEGKDLEAGKYSFELKKEDGSVVETVKNAADGTVTFSPISYDESQVGTHKYTISEVAGSEAGITYDKTVQEVEVTVEKVSATELKATASKEAKDLVFTNKYTPAKTSVSVTKAWDDKDNQDGKRPTSVTVKLLADGQDTGKTLELNAANGWTGSFTNLDADKGGTPIQYTVVEVTVAGYTSEITGDAASGFTITNSYSPETVDVKATKNWDDANNQDGKRPTKITINLLADGEKVASKEVQAAADGTWTATFEKLAKYKAGKEIKYTVTEEAVAEYEATITDFTITNKYAPKEIDYKVTKVWNDANNQDGKRPESVTVQLYKKVGNADPVAVEGKKLTLTAKEKTDDNTWVASFTNLPQYEAGKEITYSIKEVGVPAGYEASVTGQVVTNTYNPETIVLSGTKVWKDNNNQDGKRTTSVKVQILNGDKVVQEIEVSEATGWKFESKALPKYENGKLIKYTVKEVVVKGYTSTITTEKEGKYTITNEYTPEKIAVSGQKTWIDNNDQDRIRPASITVKLLADGKETDKTVKVTKATALSDNEWAYEFTGLDRYKENGQEIKYTVKEVDVPKDYQAEVDGMNVTNTHTPEKPTPGKPNEPGKPGQKPQLPNTGEKASNAAVVAGLALMAVTGGLYFVNRKNK